METIEICGGKPLYGEVDVQGSKNAALPILAATILNSGESIIHNCPDLKDVRTAFKILENLGCSISYSDNTAIINTENVVKCDIPEALMTEMRSSVMFLGAIIARCKEAKVTYPGGCELGPRPIDLHIKAFRQLGITIEEIGNFIYCSLEKFKPTIINLIVPSVGATENIMLLCAMSEGETIIVNAAKEPEIVDLQNFLNSMGADIYGAGTEIIHISGVNKLYDTEYTVIPDRIVAATYACALAACNGEIYLKKVNHEHCRMVFSVLEDSGCEIFTDGSTVKIRQSRHMRAIPKIKTAPYPGFPTDAQALLMSATCIADGTSVFVETIFESRYKHIDGLIKMGADIVIDGRVAVVKGRDYIQGARVCAGDLRGGAALVIAGTAAIGETTVDGIEHIDRGYESIERDLKLLGVNIRRKGC